MVKRFDKDIRCTHYEPLDYDEDSLRSYTIEKEDFKEEEPTKKYIVNIIIDISEQ